MPFRQAARAAAVIALAAGSAPPLAAQGLDLRAASQRSCLETAERAGHRVLHLARPVPIMGLHPGEVWGETVRLQVATATGRVQLRCVYHIDEMRSELRRH